MVPSTEDGSFDSFLGYSGKSLLDYVQKVIDEIGESYIQKKEQKEENLSLMFYLWCGAQSPFFGKSAMKTFERYFLEDKETHKEISLYWHENLQTPSFKQKLLDEFGVDRVVFGHTPRNFDKGKKIASEDGIAINIDGGFAKAYYGRGHALVQTPKQLYGVILPKKEGTGR